LYQLCSFTLPQWKFAPAALELAYLANWRSKADEIVEEKLKYLSWPL
jgi:hypothetical protein